MFERLLVANRGEIALRIFRTAKRLNMACIGVYSDADATSAHVHGADEAHRIGPAPARESYLSIEAILQAAARSRAQAIHPGYGFLSENPEFAQAVIDAGLIWVGPSPAAIAAMGLKDEAKRIARQAGAPVVPGVESADQSAKALLKAAREVGFPVLIKAVAGGGGRGIRLVEEESQFAQALAACQREAAASFGNDQVLVEKLINRPRHLEVQVFGDHHGQLIHLFERDCSVQRRRQKVLEEAPAPGMTDQVREALTQAALNIARAVGYHNAGTVEFVADGSGPLREDGFYFLEMNTRLQVEHPVTEMVTGLDLVEWQLRVAAGQALPAQEDIRLVGHAIEARICAEDPAQDFMPSLGRILEVATADDPHLRLESGVAAGDVVQPFYDSMIAKLIAWAPTRDQAAMRLAQAIPTCLLAGFATNQGFVRRALLNEDFLAGRVDTGFIPRIGQALHGSTLAQPDYVLALGGLAQRSFGLHVRVADGDPWSTAHGWRLSGIAQVSERVGPDCVPVRFATRPDGTPLRVEVNAFSMEVAGGAVCTRDDQGLRADLPGLCVIARADRAGLHVWQHGDHALIPAPRYEAAAAAQGGNDVRSHLPGRIAAILIAPGDQIEAGQGLLVLEAMKMEHTLTAPRAGLVSAIHVAAGEMVPEGRVLVELAPPAHPEGQAV